MVWVCGVGWGEVDFSTHLSPTANRARHDGDFWVNIRMFRFSYFRFVLAQTVTRKNMLILSDLLVFARVLLETKTTFFLFLLKPQKFDRLIKHKPQACEMYYLPHSRIDIRVPFIWSIHFRTTSGTAWRRFFSDTERVVKVQSHWVTSLVWDKTFPVVIRKIEYAPW